MVQPAMHILLDCSVPLPGRLEHVRNKKFVYNHNDYTYHSEDYGAQIQIVPKAIGIAPTPIKK